MLWYEAKTTYRETYSLTCILADNPLYSIKEKKENVKPNKFISKEIKKYILQKY